MAADDINNMLLRNYPGEQIEWFCLYLPKTNRWAVVFMQSTWMNYHKVGGYVGFIADKGHFCI